MKKLAFGASAALLILSIGCAPVQRSAEIIEIPAVKIAEEPSVRNDRAMLVARLGELFADPRFNDARWGVFVRSLATDEIWFESNADELLIPASNQKILTAAAAMFGLGPDFRYTTTVAHSGTILGGELRGNLIVFGQGDPTFYTQWIPDSRDHFRSWARELKARGIERITGDIIGDDNAWDDQHVGSGWATDRTAWYYAEYGALNFNENYVDLQIIPPATVEEPVRIVPNVPSAYYELINEVTVTAEGSNNIRLQRELGTNRITVSGTVRAGSESFERTPTITNPTGFFVTVLAETLREEGIAVDGNPVDCDEIEGWGHRPEDFTILIEHQSPPLLDILANMFKRSQNMVTETMVYTLAWKHRGLGTFQGGKELVNEILERELGVTPDRYRFDDGSGLSRNNGISPRTIADLNTSMRRSKYWNEWWSIQSIMGVDGTLRSRLRDTIAQGTVGGKTGTLGGVRSLSGYVTTKSGEELVFAFMVNGHNQPANVVNDITDPAVLLLAEYEGR
jgi:D-alanyl-D-alanine carboxypeptidase/D-alanyl-D-alanine-endopeptidase (penicillin-binding protein 4)